VLGELWISKSLAGAVRAALGDTLTHLSVALVNLTLNSEAREASTEYCATLQALEEGIVLFQESDSDAMSARMLTLASSMVNATAGALYVLEEVGNRESCLVLQQTLGVPDQLMASFYTPDGGAWPDALMDSVAEVATRDDSGCIAGLAVDCAPDVLQSVVVLPLRYHGVQAGICVLFNPKDELERVRGSIERLESFGRLAAALLHRLSLEKANEDNVSIERELQIAETMQKRLVPSEAPPSDGFEFAWESIAAKSIGGDYVDFLTSDLGEIYAIIADASGHGINSALLMTSFRSNYRGHAMWLEPKELAGSLNSEIVHEVGPTGMFITAALVRIEPYTGRMSLSSAGHNPAMVYRAATGEVEMIGSHGPPLGFMEDVGYEGYAGDFQAGDVLLLYTDGVTEACDSSQEMFGEDRLIALLEDHAVTGGAQGVLDATLQSLADFTGCDQHEDDVSMLVVKVKQR
jgi:serine phosphatase RsbU (regulator of sigma subunit)